MVGNAHFEHSPLFDHIKFAQACFYMEKIAKYIRDNKTTTESLPFISGGDFNSLPISSVLSAFYDESIECSQADREDNWPSVWTVEAETREEIRSEYK